MTGLFRRRSADLENGPSTTGPIWIPVFLPAMPLVPDATFTQYGIPEAHRGAQRLKKPWPESEVPACRMTELTGLDPGARRTTDPTCSIHC
jgi:hypothetical protein